MEIVGWQPAGDTIRGAPTDQRVVRGLSVEERLKLCDETTERQYCGESLQPKQPCD